MPKKPVLTKPDVSGAIIALRDILRDLLAYKGKAEIEAINRQVAADFAADDRKRKRRVRKIERLKDAARRAVEPYFEHSWWGPAALGDPWEEDGIETPEEYRARLATFISFQLDEWDRSQDVGGQGEEAGEEWDDATKQKYREEMSEELLEMMQVWDANFDPIESAGENPGTIFGPPAISGPKVFSLGWPDLYTDPQTFPPLGSPFRLKGVSVNVECIAPSVPTVGFDLAVVDGAGSTLLTANVSGGLVQGANTFQFHVPGQIPEGFIVLPDMRCRVSIEDGSSPPASDYLIRETLWMIDKP